MSAPQGSTPDLADLTAIFYDDPADLGEFEQVSAAQLPQPYRRLLAHNEHMTVTVEAFHGCSVNVQVLRTDRADEHYSRKILLRRSTDGQVVQFGIVRLDLSCLGDEVQQEILSQRTPLGRILIQHNVLREVQLGTLWRVSPGPDLCRLFGLETPVVTYGRTALIFCDGEPAVELLEIVTPA